MNTDERLKHVLQQVDNIEKHIDLLTLEAYQEHVRILRADNDALMVACKNLLVACEMVVTAHRGTTSEKLAALAACKSATKLTLAMGRITCPKNG